MTFFKRFSDRGLRTQIALVFGALVVGLAVLLSLGFGEMLKHRIQHDAQASLQVVAENAGKLLAIGLMQGGLIGGAWAVSAVMVPYFGWYFWRLARWPQVPARQVGA